MNKDNDNPHKRSIKSNKINLMKRAHRAFGPLAGGLILDFVDLLTFGPLCFILGPIVGAIVGWWITSIYNFSKRSRIIWSVMAAVYCTIPFTEILPVATVISAFARFRDDPKSLNKD